MNSETPKSLFRNTMTWIGIGVGLVVSGATLVTAWCMGAFTSNNAYSRAPLNQNNSPSYSVDLTALPKPLESLDVDNIQRTEVKVEEKDIIVPAVQSETCVSLKTKSSASLAAKSRPVANSEKNAIVPKISQPAYVIPAPVQESSPNLTSETLIRTPTQIGKTTNALSRSTQPPLPQSTAFSNLPPALTASPAPTKSEEKKSPTPAAVQSTPRSNCSPTLSISAAVDPSVVLIPGSNATSTSPTAPFPTPVLPAAEKNTASSVLLPNSNLSPQPINVPLPAVPFSLLKSESVVAAQKHVPIPVPKPTIVSLPNVSAGTVSDQVRIVDINLAQQYFGGEIGIEELAKYDKTSLEAPFKQYILNFALNAPSKPVGAFIRILTFGEEYFKLFGHLPQNMDVSPLEAKLQSYLERLPQETKALLLKKETIKSYLEIYHCYFKTKSLSKDDHTDIFGYLNMWAIIEQLKSKAAPYIFPNSSPQAMCFAFHAHYALRETIRINGEALGGLVTVPHERTTSFYGASSFDIVNWDAEEMSKFIRGLKLARTDIMNNKNRSWQACCAYVSSIEYFVLLLTLLYSGIDSSTQLCKIREAALIVESMKLK